MTWRLRWRGGLLLVASICAIAFAFQGVARDPGAEFNHQLWISHRGDESPGNPRWSMLDSAEKKLHVGMPRSEVIEILGAPDGEDTTSRTVYWILGMHSGFGVDVDALHLEFDPQLRIVRWGWRQH